jgi:hypothetical protein
LPRAPTTDGAFQNLNPVRVEVDEMWTFTYATQRNVPRADDGWTWVAVDADTNLAPSWLVAQRTVRGLLHVARRPGGAVEARSADPSSRAVASRAEKCEVGGGSRL